MVVYAVGPDGPGYFVSALYTLTGGVAAENFEKDSALSGFAGELFCLWDVKGWAFSTGLRQPFLNLFILMAQFDCHQRGVTVAESANAYASTVMTAAFSASSRGSTLSKVSAAVW